MQENINNQANDNNENKPLAGEETRPKNSEVASAQNPDAAPAADNKDRNFSNNKQHQRKNFEPHKNNNFKQNNNNAGNNNGASGNFHHKNNDRFNKNQNWRDRNNVNNISNDKARSNENNPNSNTNDVRPQSNPQKQFNQSNRNNFRHNNNSSNNFKRPNFQSNNNFSQKRPTGSTEPLDQRTAAAANVVAVAAGNNEIKKNELTVEQNSVILTNFNETSNVPINAVKVDAVENANNDLALNAVSNGISSNCGGCQNHNDGGECQCPEKISDGANLTADEMQNSKLVADSAEFEGNLETGDNKDQERSNNYNNFDKPQAVSAPSNYRVPDGQKLLGIRFKTAGEIYYIPNENMDFKVKERIIVRLEKGKEMAEVAVLQAPGDARIIDPNIRVLRRVNDADLAQEERNREREKEGFKICLDKIKKLELPMKLLAVKYLFDGSRITFYFKADSKVDFRKLVRELAAVFRTRIELRQIGPRDETELFGGFGVCGRQVCCSYWNCRAKSVVSAENQRMPLLSMQTIQGKIMGLCSRPLCCLRYEGEADPLAKISALTVGSKLLVEERNAVLKAVDEATTQLIIEVEGDKDKERSEIKLTYEDLTLKVQEGKIKLK